MNRLLAADLFLLDHGFVLQKDAPASRTLTDYII